MITSVLLMLSMLIEAQIKFQMDTVYANDQKTVALFFPQPITQGITGSENFVFTYNREREQNFGLLQAAPGEESNLLIICNNGFIYSYIIQYKKQLTTLNYFIKESESVGNLRSTQIDTIKRNTLINKPSKELDDYKEFCSYLIKKDQHIGSIKKRYQGIILSLENIVFHEGELYFVIHLENRSSLAYDINFLNLSIQTRTRGQRKSKQTLIKKPVFKYQVPPSLKEGQKVSMVYVLPKFSISEDRRVIFELNEKNGERNIELKISHRYINNPN